MAKTVMVTGSNGFVGRHVVRELKTRGCRVIGVGTTPAAESDIDAYHACDLTHPDEVAKLPLTEVDALINLAAMANVGSSFEQAELYKEVNVSVLTVIGRELLKQSLPVRVIAVSTGTAYDPHQPMPLTETSRLTDTASPYTMSKIFMEQAAAELQQDGLNCIVVRPFNHIGPGQTAGFLIPDLYTQIKQALAERSPLTVGNLKTRRDYTDVRDVVRAQADLALAPTVDSRLFNICSGQSLAGEEVLKVLLKVMKAPENFEIIVDQSRIRPNDPPELYGSYERLHNAIGWQPAISFEQTIIDFVSTQP